MEVKLSDLALAVDFSSSGLLFDSCTYLNRCSGKIVYTGDLIDDEELPDDLYDNPDYVEIPSKQDMNLGKRLVLRFAAEHLSEHVETVHNIFSRRGAYGRFKVLLDQTNMLDEWYRYEEKAVTRELLEWCLVNEITVNEDS
ncbi:UPF0158 family protein [Ferrimonas sp. SCSIO 43195]|uniref:UPF0158 family protein n=1 Tax=Ferrimonas sp. SCSIO 43195 TaxID=2822844 RepID=UPI002075BE14|nr:UPF0158 family protein [Ferrimonas sp. SCSIO 43195]USD36180.1 hypothetical protein J8Z22_14185 [Ferrimonas sp. SCSIO 43195]